MRNIICYDLDGNQLTCLAQGDRDVYITIQEAFIKEAHKIHFFNISKTIAYVVESSYSNGKLTAKIPNALLIYPYEIIGYIFDEDGEGGGRSIARIRISVVARPQPADTIYDDTDDYISYYEIMENCQAFAIAEAARVTAEQARNSAEELRIAAEATRENNENDRKIAENQRVIAENKRDNDTEKAIDDITEAILKANNATEQFNKSAERIENAITEIENKINEKTQAKADKVTDATAGNIAVLDENGNYINSGESLADLKDSIPQIEIDDEFDENSGNPVSNAALTAAFGIALQALNVLKDRVDQLESGGTGGSDIDSEVISGIQSDIQTLQSNMTSMSSTASAAMEQLSALNNKVTALENSRTHYKETLINKRNIISNVPLATISSGELYPAENLLEIGKSYIVSINGVEVVLESFAFDEFVAIGDSQEESYGFIFGTMETDVGKFCGLDVTNIALCLQTFNYTMEEAASAVVSIFTEEEITAVHKLSNDYLNIDNEFDPESNNPISNKTVCELLEELALWTEEIENKISSLPKPKTYTPGNGIAISEAGVISLALANAEEVVI